MKTLFKFALAIVSLVLVVSSCSKDPAPAVEDPAVLIVGEWNLLKSHDIVKVDGAAISDDIYTMGPDEKLTFILNADKSFKIIDEYVDDKGVTQKSEDVGIWKLGNESDLLIKYSYDNEFIPLEIKKLSETELVLFVFEVASSTPPREFHTTLYFDRVK